MLSVHEQGAEQAIAHLTQIQAGIESGMRSTTEKAVLYVLSTVPGYPSAPATSKYRRTGTLGRSLSGLGSASGDALSRVEGAGSTVTGYVGSGVRYAGYVVGDAEGHQAWMHVGHWWTLLSVVQKARPGIVRIYEDWVRRLVG